MSGSRSGSNKSSDSLKKVSRSGSYKTAAPLSAAASAAATAAASSSAAATLYLYLHTHWDREWYWSFGAYRTQLVTVIHDVLDLLEGGELEKFMLDGQTALIEDAMAVSPGIGPRIRALVKAGKLAIGPWYVLADQMLVCGESLVRNLHFGLQLSNFYGGATMVGYCPDTFGHTADMPRILRGFGIDCAVVWRGVPRLSHSPLFAWKSADGSEVLALDLTQGYYQTQFGENLSSEDLSKSLLAFLGLEQHKGALRNLSREASTIVPQLAGALLPVGGDHVGPQADFKKQLAAALKYINSGEAGADKKSDQEGAPQTIKAQVVSLNQFFSLVRAASKDDDPLAVVETELRSNDFALQYARAYMLAGVLSSRLYLKRENRLSEHKILRQVEPFRALLDVHGILPFCGEEIDFNWKLLMKNHPHDSICGCSIDSVHREMQTRTVSLNDSLDVLLAQGKEALLVSAAGEKDVRFGARHLDVIDPAINIEQVAVFNPSTTPYVGPVRLRLAMEAGKNKPLPEGFQKLGSVSATETFLGLSKVPVFKDILIVDGYIDAGTIPGATLKTVPLASGSSFALGNRGVGLMQVAVAGAMGAGISECEGSFGGLQVSNEYFNLSFDKSGELILSVINDGGTASGESRGGTIKLGHNFVDVGDAGDSYNFDPLAADRPLVAKLVSVSPGRKGPLVASLVAHYQIDLPEGLIAKEDVGKRGESEEAPKLTVFERSRVRIPHKIESEIILKKGVPIVFFQTTMHNSATDHRLEVVFDLPRPSEFTLSENHFGLIKRYHDKNAQLNPPVDAEDMIALGREAPLDRYPCQRFFVAGEGTYLNIGLPEYGVGDSAVSITLLRAVSYLSRKRLRSRGGGAGPIMPTPEGNCPGAMRASYGFAPTILARAFAGGQVSSEAAPFILADLFEGVPLAFGLPLGGVADKSLSLFSIDDPDIRLSAAFIDEEERLVIRLLNATSRPKSILFTERINAQAVSLANLDGSGERQIFAKSKDGDCAQFSLDFTACQLLTILCRI